MYIRLTSCEESKLWKIWCSNTNDDKSQHKILDEIPCLIVIIFLKQLFGMGTNPITLNNESLMSLTLWSVLNSSIDF